MPLPVAKILPEDVRTALIRAAQIKEPLVRAAAIEEVVARAKRRCPQFFQSEKEVVTNDAESKA